MVETEPCCSRSSFHSSSEEHQTISGDEQLQQQSAADAGGGDDRKMRMNGPSSINSDQSHQSSCLSPLRFPSANPILPLLFRSSVPFSLFFLLIVALTFAPSPSSAQNTGKQQKKAKIPLIECKIFKNSGKCYSFSPGLTILGADYRRDYGLSRRQCADICKR